MATMNILIAGFGGQGVLFAGKFLAYGALIQDKQVSWLPSYGPEMRGGTANCSVIISDTPVGSPIISTPDHLVVMNLPSFQKYQDTVVPGGVLLYDSTLIQEQPHRSDIRCFGIPATQLAKDMGAPTLANMILLGAIVKETGCVSPEHLEEGLRHAVPPRHADLIDLNLKALEIGKNYTQA